MSAVPAAAVPRLSQIAGWDVQHLQEAARNWSVTAHLAFTEQASRREALCGRAKLLTPLRSPPTVIC